MGVSGITLVECDLYHRIFGCPHDPAVFCRIIHAVDIDFMERQHKKREADSKRKH